MSSSGFLLVRHRNVRQGKGKQYQQNGKRRADIKLHMAQLETGETHAPHRQNKANGTPDTDRWEVSHNIHAGRLQAVIRYSIDQAQRRHIGQRVKQDHKEHRPGVVTSAAMNSVMAPTT